MGFETIPTIPRKNTTESPVVLEQETKAENTGETLEKNVAEYNQEEGVAKIKELIEEKLKEKTGPVIVEVAGGSASGKGFLSAKLREMYGDEITYIAVDDYYRGGKFVEDEAKKGNIINFDQPEALDLDKFKNDLEDLKAGKTIKKPIFDFKKGEPTEETIDVMPNKIIIVDGLFVLEDSIAQRGDVKAFVEVGVHGRIIRRLLRDIERTSQKPKDILNYFAKFVQPMHEKYVESTKLNADLIVLNEYSPAIESLRAGHDKQLKFEAGDISQEQILSSGAKLVEAIDQEDVYYNPADRNLAETDEILRIRTERRPPEAENQDVKEDMILTYKGPRIKDDASILDRPKFEFAIDKDVANNILSLYPNAIRTIKKRRELYELNGIYFSLDEVTVEKNGQDIKLGKYIEVRSNNKTPDAEAFDSVLSRLGLKMENGIKRAYAEM